MTADATETMDSPVGASARIFNMTAPGPALSWAWARDRLDSALMYWVTTASRSGYPHTRPVWGAWHADAFWFASQNRCIEHIADNPQVSVNITRDDDVVVVEGIAERVTDHEDINVLVAAYAAKYSWESRAESGMIKRTEGTTAPVFRVTPIRAYGWPLAGWENVTRWSFAEVP